MCGQALFVEVNQPYPISSLCYSFLPTVCTGPVCQTFFGIMWVNFFSSS